MRGRKSSYAKPVAGKSTDGVPVAMGRAAEQVIVPAKQQLGFEVPGITDSPHIVDTIDPKRLIFASCASIGSHAELVLRSGETIEGILLCVRPGPEGGYVLGDVKTLSGKEAHANEFPQPFRGKVVYSASEVVCLTARDVDMTGSMGPLANGVSNLSFNTDIEISKSHRQELVNRELQPWIPDGDGEALEGLSSNPSQTDRLGRWDQFAANKAQFGVNTTFNEDIYTTKLDRSKAGISEKDAARIAREIEGKKTNNPHLAEERGQIAYREADADEEARYSAVARRQGKIANDRLIDSRNEETFGSISPQEGGKAWSGSANSVAAITGRASSTGKSAPIDMDPRREHNKVRLQLAGSNSNKERSPFGTPKGGRSPLFSPLVGNAAQVEALDLNVGTGIKYDPTVRSEFRKFKQAFRQGSISPSNDSELAKQLSASLGSPVEEAAASSDGNLETQQHDQTGARSAQHVPASGPTQNQRKPLMSFATSHTQGASEEVRRKLLASNMPSPSFNFGSIASADESTAAGESNAASSRAHDLPTTSGPAGVDPPKSQGIRAPASRLEGRPMTAPASKLNPQAKEFKFNPGAVSFNPGGLSRATSGASSAAAPLPKTPAPTPSAESGIPSSKQPVLPRPGTAGPGRLPSGSGRGSVGFPGRGTTRMSRDVASGRGIPGSPKLGRPDRRELQSARPHSAAFNRPMMPQDGTMMSHSHMMQQQHHHQQQMMASGGMLAGPPLAHLGPHVPPYEMTPARPPFAPGHYHMMPGQGPMFASSPYQQGAPPMMMSPPHNQHSAMYPQQAYPLGVVYPGHAMGMMIPHYEGGH